VRGTPAGRLMAPIPANPGAAPAAGRGPAGANPVPAGAPPAAGRGATPPSAPPAAPEITGLRAPLRLVWRAAL